MKNWNNDEFFKDSLEFKSDSDKSSTTINGYNVVCFIENSSTISINDIFMIFAAERFAHQNNGKIFLVVENLKPENQIEIVDILQYCEIVIDGIFCSMGEVYDIQINYAFKSYSNQKKISFLYWRHLHLVNFVPLFNKDNQEDENTIPELRYLIKQGYPSLSLKEFLLSCAYEEFLDWRKSNPNAYYGDFPVSLNYAECSFNLAHLQRISKDVISKMSANQVLQLSLEWAKRFEPKLAEQLAANQKYYIAILNIERTSVKPRKDLEKWIDISSFSDCFFDGYYEYNLNFPDDLTASKIKEILSNYLYVYDDKSQREKWWDDILCLGQELGFAKNRAIFSEQPESFVGEIGDLLIVLRIAITGKTSAPDLYEVFQVMGKERVTQRLIHCLNMMENGTPINYYISKDLVALASKLSCYFVDHHTLSKDAVKKLSFYNKNELEKSNYKGFIISTCLRFEQYDFSGSEYLSKDLFYAQRLFALRRMLILMSGLQSEIIGEREILIQIRQAIEKSFHEGRISKTDYQALENLMQISSKIRKDYLVEVKENYSTIAAKIFNQNLNRDAAPIIMIIGAGYMAVEFLKEIYPRSNKIIWVNRNTKKIRKFLVDNEEFDSNKFIIATLEECRTYFPLLDGLFVAISNRFHYFNEKDISRMQKDSIIVDISYPEVIPDSDSVRIYNIKNTNFNLYVDKNIEKQKLSQAHAKIEQIIEEINNRSLEV